MILHLDKINIKIKTKPFKCEKFWLQIHED